MDHDNPPMEAQLVRLLDDLVMAYDEAAEHIAAIPHLQESFEGAAALLERVLAMNKHSLGLRNKKIRAIRDAERLSLAVLGQRTGLSKAGVAKLFPAPAPTTDQEGPAT